MMEKIIERPELCQLYLEFLSLSIKTYIFAVELINQEVAKFTNNDLNEGWIFFLLVFSHAAPIEKIENLNVLKKYIENPLDKHIVLTNKGEELYDYLNKKVDLHSNILKFNGISFYDLIGDINSMSKMMKFWKVLIKPVNN